MQHGRVISRDVFYLSCTTPAFPMSLLCIIVGLLRYKYIIRRRVREFIYNPSLVEPMRCSVIISHHSTQSLIHIGQSSP